MFERRNVKSSRGAVIVAVIVLMVVCLTLAGLWAQSVVRERARLQSDLYRMQATRLAEAGIRQGHVRQSENPGFAGDTWAVPAEFFGGPNDANVEIVVSQIEDGTRVEAQAQYPASAVRRAQITKQKHFPNPIPRVEP